MAIIHLHIELDTARGDSLHGICKQIARGIEQTENRPVASEGGTPAPAAPAAPRCRNLYEDISQFLDSGARYTKRTASAIAKGLNVGEDVIKEHLDVMVSNGQLRTLTRRRDGETLYELTW